jgi:hypothetical protein
MKRLGIISTSKLVSIIGLSDVKLWDFAIIVKRLEETDYRKDCQEDAIIEIMQAVRFCGNRKKGLGKTLYLKDCQGNAIIVCASCEVLRYRMKHSKITAKIEKVSIIGCASCGILRVIVKALRKNLITAKVVRKMRLSGTCRLWDEISFKHRKTSIIAKKKLSKVCDNWMVRSRENLR